MAVAQRAPGGRGVFNEPALVGRRTADGAAAGGALVPADALKARQARGVERVGAGEEDLGLGSEAFLADRTSGRAADETTWCGGVGAALLALGVPGLDGRPLGGGEEGRWPRDEAAALG
jgi:hypothetical protein